MEKKRQTRGVAAFSGAARRCLPLVVLATSLLIGPPVVATEVSSADTAAEQASRIGLWPKGLAPRDKTLPQPQRIVERIVERSADPTLPDRYIQQISTPYLVVYRPKRPNGTALLVTPGGGYQRIVLDNEGSALVPSFVDQAGITLFVLRYRLPGEGHPNGADVPLADAQRALRLIRANAARYGIDAQRVGVMGFSAGGHVAASLGTRYAAQVYPKVDAADALSARPDFELLIYPVIDMDSANAHAGSRERLLGSSPSDAQVRAYSPQLHVDARTPPSFLLHAQDDTVVSVRNSLLMHDALLRADVPSELHVFPQGGHGFGTASGTGLTVAAWPQLAQAWIAHVSKAQTPSTATTANASVAAPVPTSVPAQDAAQ
ncbi:alpha/beta hydrolase [Xanthomonas hortorum pv. vitians]|uniref:alpha/beta hydrolase n=1 Tax=Xanthomonas hortorum TaxID=56454 RepID=UPI000BAAA6AB|nr:alpha/beta hydrolase [Xanthomonas hortorum]ASW47378.1 xylanase [Xanthomonas hortorum]MCE4307563.1 alpha/beta hydrolase [Xanthomonas hortorum pv. vitians]MCE4335681.1 alpha/beta hydrolase [Xanthomonas hortorum pv. vitians]MCE4505221.1 alpha/beta hydrolase [Xanthomonas hortorum pv. vitians]MDT7819185.1 alpha/beta hydrolase [Xanthomonas hortorum pv. vitians]